MQTSGAASLMPLAKQAFIGHLTRSFTSASSYRKPAHPGNAIARLTQRIERFTQAESQWADYACTHHRDARSEPFPVPATRSGHFEKEKLIAISIAFLKEAL